jgi:hypothetical protein
MGLTYFYEGRRWLGWFNSPGSYVIAKHLGGLENSRFWSGLFPGPNESPAIVFGLDGKKGPQYVAAMSGTTMSTGHLAYLTMQRSRELEPEGIEGRQTVSFGVAYLAMKHTNCGSPIERIPVTASLMAFLPTTVSIVTCIMCALVYDWLSFSLILIGIVSTGYASLVIGQRKLVIKSVKPAPGAPPDHGLLMGDGEVVVIKGEERDVNVITRGRFDLESYTDQWGDEEKCTARKRRAITAPNYHGLGACSLLLLSQFFLQILLIPQGSLFGQIMFLVSLAVSWGYNTYLLSLEKEKFQARILFEALGSPKMLRFRTGTRTTMAVFVCLLIFHGVKRCSDERDRMLRLKCLVYCIPNDTVVWKRWKDKVVQQLLSIDDLSDSLPHLAQDEEDQTLAESDRNLLGTLLKDADAAFRGYFCVRDRLPEDSSH